MSDPLLATPAGKPRARALGIPFDGRPGPCNAITDVPGVEVGYCTLIRGEAGPLRVGEGPVRTGVTAIVPRGRARAAQSVWAAQHSLNGNGELTGSWWIEEGRPMRRAHHDHQHAFLRRDAGRHNRMAEPPHTRLWRGRVLGPAGIGRDLGRLAERHQRVPCHAGAHLRGDRPGGGRRDRGGQRGRRARAWCSTDTRAGRAPHRARWIIAARPTRWARSCRRISGLRSQLTIAGIPMAEHLPGEDPYAADTGSIIAVVGTDAPFLPHQCKRLARRVSPGGGPAAARSRGHGSGDIFLAFSTGPGAEALSADEPVRSAECRRRPPDRPVLRSRHPGGRRGDHECSCRQRDDGRGGRPHRAGARPRQGGRRAQAGGPLPRTAGAVIPHAPTVVPIIGETRYRVSAMRKASAGRRLPDRNSLRARRATCCRD